MTLELDEHARAVMAARHLRRDAGGAVVEAPEECLVRVARAVADAELRFARATDAAVWERAFLTLAG